MRHGRLITFLFFSFFVHICICPNGISPVRNSGCLPRGNQLRQSGATQPTVHAGCFRVSIIHRTLIWTTASLTWAQMLSACDCTQGCTDNVRDSAFEADPGRKVPCHTGESNLPQRRAGPLLYQLSHIPTPTSRTTMTFL